MYENPRLFFNGYLYGFWGFLFLIALIALVYNRKVGKVDFFWGIIFLCAIYIPGQSSTIFTDPHNSLAIESFLFVVMFFAFNRNLQTTARVFMVFTGLMICTNALYITYPDPFTMIYGLVDPIPGVIEEGEFLRKQVINILFGLMCLSVLISSYLDGRSVREPRHDRYILQKI